MKKISVHTKGEQKAAAEILTQLMFVKNMDDLSKCWDRLYKEYNLLSDPFTHCPVTIDEYVHLSNEYAKQKMEERFGYYE